MHTKSELTFWKTDRAEPFHSVKNDSAYDLSLHPDGRQMLAACYSSGGSTGNGARKRFRENYVPNGTKLRVFSLFAKPVEKSG